MRELSTPQAAAAARALARDLALVLGVGFLLLATGMGLRDPWPADEPRFALIARDMVTSGDWLFPRVGGDLYQDKPPLFFWLMAAAYALTGSLRLSFLLPSLLAGLGTLALVYDLTRRLWNREAGLWAALILLFTLQFTLQARAAQIDATLCFLTTLSLYALLRHLLLNDGWGWYVLGGFAAGLGVITKGVGFLPLLVLLPYGYARWRRWPLPKLSATPLRWSGAPIAFVCAIALWFVPMLIAVGASDDPALAAYRDEILFQQTVSRYATAWHHQKPFYYFFGVILTQWLPLIALLPWLAPRWIEKLRERDVRILLLLGWVALVLLFFSASPGKRGVYILPALPALAIASGEWLRGLWQRPDVQKTGAVFGVFVVLASAAAYIYLSWLAPERAVELREQYGLRYLAPLIGIAVLGSIALVVCGARRGALACAWVLGLTWLVVSLTIYPQINASRSATEFIARLEQVADPKRELGLLAYKEQFLLHLDRPSVNFGHRRWREGPLESYDAARWLGERPDRQLLVQEEQLEPCFARARERIDVGMSARERWVLVSGPVSPDCASRGKPQNVIHYSP
jgi:4-amino-4-deoxy-L-arabinose transferase-like glycosyltransferase